MPTPRFLACLFVMLTMLPVHAQQSAAPASPPTPAPPMLKVPLNDASPTLSLPGAATKPEVPATPASPGVPAARAAESAPIAPIAPTPDATQGRPMSTTGQFVIHGGDLMLRTWIGQRCDEVADDLKRALRDNRDWSIPIVIALKVGDEVKRDKPLVGASFAQLTEGGFHLQLTFQICPEFNVAEMRDELIRMLLAERILRDHKAMTTTRARILPNWLLVGVKEAMQFRKRARPSALFASVFNTGRVYGVEEILDTAPTELTAATRPIYETSCCALLLTLLDQPEGGLRLGKFLNSLAVENGTDRELIDRWFPGIARSTTSLEKWWTLQMASLSRPSVFESMGPDETSKALDKALMMHFMVEVGNEPAPVAAKKPADTEEAADEDKPKSVFARWFGRSKADEDSAAKETPKPDKKAETKPAPKPLTDEELATKKGFFGRLFGSDDKTPDEPSKKKAEPKKQPEKPVEKKPEPKKEPEKPQPKKDEPKKAEPPATKESAPASKKPEPEKPKVQAAGKSKTEEEPKRPGLLRRMFSSDKKDDDASKEKDKPKPESKPKPEPKKEEPKPEDDKPAPVKLPPVIKPIGAMLLRAVMPRSVLALEMAEALQPAGNGARYTFLGFGKKKDGDKDKADSDARTKEKDKPKAEPKKDEKKPEKKEEKKEEPKTPAKEAKAEPQKETPKPEPKKMVPASLPLEDYSRVLKRSDARQILAGTLAELNTLQQHAHTLFRPVIGDYAKVVTDLMAGKTKDIDARLNALKAIRAEALTQARAAQPAPDANEATNNNWPGLLEDYLRAEETNHEQLPKEIIPRSPEERLEQWEKELQKQKEEELRRRNPSELPLPRPGIEPR